MLFLLFFSENTLSSPFGYFYTHSPHPPVLVKITDAKNCNVPCVSSHLITSLVQLESLFIHFQLLILSDFQTNWNIQLIHIKSWVHLIHREKRIWSAKRPPDAVRPGQINFSLSSKVTKLWWISSLDSMLSLSSFVETFTRSTDGFTQVTAECLLGAQCKIHWEPLQIFCFNLE